MAKKEKKKPALGVREGPKRSIDVRFSCQIQVEDADGAELLDVSPAVTVNHLSSPGGKAQERILDIVALHGFDLSIELQRYGHRIARAGAKPQASTT